MFSWIALKWDGCRSYWFFSLHTGLTISRHPYTLTYYTENIRHMLASVGNSVWVSVIHHPILKSERTICTAPPPNHPHCQFICGAFIAQFPNFEQLFWALILVCVSHIKPHNNPSHIYIIAPHRPTQNWQIACRMLFGLRSVLALTLVFPISNIRLCWSCCWPLFMVNLPTTREQRTNHVRATICFTE